MVRSSAPQWKKMDTEFPYGSNPALRMTSYILFPPRLMVRYWAANMVFNDTSFLTSPANPGTSGITTTTCEKGSVEYGRGEAHQARTHLELLSSSCGLVNSFDESLRNGVLDRTLSCGVWNANFVLLGAIPGTPMKVSHKNWFSINNKIWGVNKTTLGKQNLHTNIYVVSSFKNKLAIYTTTELWK